MKNYGLLYDQWRLGKSIIISHVVNTICFVSDDEIIVCGFSDGNAKVFDISSGRKKFKMQCGIRDVWSINQMDYSGYGYFKIELGKDVIVTFSSGYFKEGIFSTWNRTDGTLMSRAFYQDCQITAMKFVEPSSLLAGFHNGSFVSIKDDAIQTIKEKGEVANILHIDSDGSWTVTCHKENMKIWKTTEKENLIEDVREPIPVKSAMCALKYPLAFVAETRFSSVDNSLKNIYMAESDEEENINFDDFEGDADSYYEDRRYGYWNRIQIFDLQTGNLLRIFNFEGYGNLYIEDRFLIVTERSETFEGEVDWNDETEDYEPVEHVEDSFVLFDIKDLTEFKEPELKKLKEKSFEKRIEKLIHENTQIMQCSRFEPFTKCEVSPVLDLKLYNVLKCN